VVDKDRVIIVGHTRYLAAMELGWTEAPVHIAAQLTPAQAKAYRLMDNKSHERAEWDTDLLALEMVDLQGMEFDLSLTGFDMTELDALAAPDGNATEGDTEPQIDRAEELRVKWGVETGDLWQLGEHRLLCGDSTKAEDVARVMGGERADAVLTDPPYGIADTASDKNNYDEYNDSKENLINLIAQFLPIAQRIAPVVVLTPGNGNSRLYPPPIWTMAWFTPAGIGSGPWGFCCWQPILCYGKDPKLTKGKGRHPDAIAHTESAEKLGHPCSKPIGFWEWLMNRTSEEGERIYEPFSGSGTTIIACENLGRKCRAIEISPAYVAVALERWATHTGQTPIKLSP
jgi:site-specific DNA-methyltransferase (adenine-specific)